MFKRSLIAASVMGALAAAGTAHATNGYQLIGVGAYQKSLAGAVTAAPGSAMTAISNPAGLARIEDRADFSMEAFMPKRYTDFSKLGGEKVDSDAELYGVPALGWKGPVGESGKMWFGGGMYGTSGLGVDYPYSTMVDMGGGMTADFEGYSAIQFWQMAPALAWNVNEKLDLGVSLNIDYQAVSFKQRFVDNAGGVILQNFLGAPVPVNEFNFDLSRSAAAFGFGFTIGALYDVNERLTLGASYKSKQSFSDLEYNLAAGDITFDDVGNPGTAGQYTLGLDFPQQLAVGLAYDVSDKVTVSADVKWINWEDTMDDLAVEGPNGFRFSMDPGWEDQIVYAVGVQFAVNEKVNLRTGYNYSKAPLEDEDVISNLILPAVVEQHFTVGGDVKLDKHWDLGFHAMYVPEESFTDASGVEIAMKQSSVGVNLGYRF